MPDWNGASVAGALEIDATEAFLAAAPRRRGERRPTVRGGFPSPITRGRTK